MKHQPPGIYFNLSNEDYHDDIALSNSGIKNLLVSPMTYWVKSPMNPEKVEKKTPAMELSTAFHAALLEPELFEEEYDVIPARIKYTGDKPNFVREKDYEKIEYCVKQVKEHPATKNLLSGGYAEVSIFWEDPTYGIPCRARHDYLNLGSSTDYKAMAEIDEKSQEKAISNYNYDIQTYWYLEALDRIKEMMRSHDDFETDANYEQLTWLEKFAEVEHSNFNILWQQKEIPHFVDPVVMGPSWKEGGSYGADLALRIWRAYYEKFGEDKWEIICGSMREVNVSDEFTLRYDWILNNREEAQKWINNLPS